MQVINPSFDPDTNTWYLEERSEEASTIRDLLRLLGKGFRVANYYPLIERRETRDGGSVVNQKYDHESILNMWAEGKSGAEIAKALDMSRVRVNDIVWRARNRGDRRAVPRITRNSESV